MKRKYTESKKANRAVERRENLFTTPVWLRRFWGYYGADRKHFDEKHPMLQDYVDGLKSRMQKRAI